MAETDTPKKKKKPDVGSDATVGSKTMWWQVGLYASTIGITVLLILLTLGRLIFQGEFHAGSAVAALMVGALAWTLVTASNTPAGDHGGINIGTSEPALADFVREVADAVGAPNVEAVYLVNGPNLTIVEDSSFYGLKHENRAVLVGLPFLHTMTKREIAAMLAHHFGHFADGHANEGARTMRAVRAAANMIRQERRSQLNGVFGSYARKISRSVGGVAVVQEEQAERAAVEAFGTEAMLSGLAKLDDVESAWDQMLRHYVVPALQHGLHPAEFYEGFEALVASSERAEARASDVEQRRSNEAIVFEPHKTPGQRAAIVSRWPATEGNVQLVDGDAPGYTLLDPEAKSTEIVVGTWAHKLMDSQTEPASWQQLNDEIYSAASYKLARRGFAGDELDAGEQFEQVLEWSDTDWANLDEALSGVKSLKRLEIGERRLKWAEAVVIEAAAASDDYGWKRNWDGPPQLMSNTGASFDADPIAQLIVDGESSQARSDFERLVGVPASSN